MPPYFSGRTTAYAARQPGGGRWWLVVIALVLVAGAGVGGYYSRSIFRNGNSRPDGNGDTPVQQDPVLTSGILVGNNDPLGGELEGVVFFNNGDYDQAIRWFDDYLSAGVQVPKADACLYYLGLAWFKRASPSEMSAAWKRLAEEFPRSDYTGRMLYDTSRLTPDPDERSRTLYLAWKGFSRTKEGKLAALQWADEAYDRYAGTETDYSKWDDIWAAYSIALDSVAEDAKQKVFDRIARVAGYLVLDPRGRPAGAYTVTVNPGDSISYIAHKNKVPVESIVRVNGLKSDVIQPGDELKIYPLRSRIVIDKKLFTLDLFVNGRFYKRYSVGVGQGELTPSGNFAIRHRVPFPTWHRGPDRIPYGNPENILGTRWMGFGHSGPGKSIGIHGTSEPETVPGAVSQGCIRMVNRDVEEVYDLVPSGTEVVIK
ncbi:MAG: L,D-transpeptidase family protein [Planctomycetes bacterium]|nr:L,D-transpeptidase family protein [Planctomycetota bacterium]